MKHNHVYKAWLEREYMHIYNEKGVIQPKM